MAKSNLFIHYGQCPCGSVRVIFKSVHDLGQFSPRKCDCNFCTENSASYISDPKGNLSFSAENSVRKKKQGDKLADFIFCSVCESLVGVIYKEGSVVFGAVNCGILNDKKRLQEYTLVSPQLISSQEKKKRWVSNWTPVDTNGVV